MFFVLNKSHEYHELPKVKIKESIKNKQFALMLEQENGEYKESVGELPTEGYVFNANKSGCTDINGKIISNSIDYDYETYTVLVDTSKTSYCYLYYDIEPNISYLRINDNGNFLSKNLVGGMYRYQGIYTDDIRNYICLGDNCCDTTECDADDSDDMYRIIGVTPTGELKVIKKTALTDEVQWWSDITKDIKWPQSLPYQRLNGKGEDGTTEPNYNDENSYYYSLNKNLKSIIVKEHSWLYGDAYSTNDFGYNGDTIYGIESGKSEAIYHNQKDIQGSPTGKGVWSDKIQSPIGLMYISDYYYAYITSEEYVVNSWIHISHNQSTNNNEWTMSRYGFFPSGNYYIAWCPYSYGHMEGVSLRNAFAIRPTFYISNEIELTDEGTLSNPFRITGVD